MKLLTKGIEKALPPLDSNDDNPDPAVIVKFFTPWGRFTWYAVEGERVTDPDDFVFFGYVQGLDDEWGYFTLHELESIKGFGGYLRVERELHFEPTPISEIVKKKM